MRAETKAGVGVWWRTWRIGRWLLAVLVLALIWRTVVLVIRSATGAPSSRGDGQGCAARPGHTRPEELLLAGV